MPIKAELQKLKQIDIWSLMLFILYNFQKVPEYSSLSELAYILDEKSLLKLCEYFGGQTITIPTIDQLEELIFSLLLYQYVDIENIPMNEAITLLRLDKSIEKEVKASYKTVKGVLNNYEFTARNRI